MPYLAVGGVGLGVGWGSGPLGAATRCPRRRRPFHFFLATWPFLAIRNVRVLGFTDDDDDETGLPPLNPLVLRTENRQIFIANFFFQKKIWRQIFFGDFKNGLFVFDLRRGEIERPDYGPENQIMVF